MKVVQVLLAALVAICLLPITTVVAQAFGKNLLGSVLVHRRYSTQAPVPMFRYVKNKRQHNSGSVYFTRTSRVTTPATTKEVTPARVPDSLSSAKTDK